MRKSKFPVGTAIGVGAGAATVAGIAYALYARPQWRWALADLGRQIGTVAVGLYSDRLAPMFSRSQAVPAGAMAAADEGPSLEDVVHERLHSEEPANPEVAEAFREAIGEE